MCIHTTLSAIRQVPVYGKKFSKLSSDDRRRIAESIGDKINSDTLRAAITTAKNDATRPLDFQRS